MTCNVYNSTVYEVGKAFVGQSVTFAKENLPFVGGMLWSFGSGVVSAGSGVVSIVTTVANSKFADFLTCQLWKTPERFQAAYDFTVKHGPTAIEWGGKCISTLGSVLETIGRNIPFQFIYDCAKPVLLIGGGLYVGKTVYQNTPDGAANLIGKMMTTTALVATTVFVANYLLG